MTPAPQPPAFDRLYLLVGAAWVKRSACGQPQWWRATEWMSGTTSIARVGLPRADADHMRAAMRLPVVPIRMARAMAPHARDHAAMRTSRHLRAALAGGSMGAQMTHAPILAHGMIAAPLIAMATTADLVPISRLPLAVVCATTGTTTPARDATGAAANPMRAANARRGPSAHPCATTGKHRPGHAERHAALRQRTPARADGDREQR